MLYIIAEKNQTISFSHSQTFDNDNQPNTTTKQH